MILINPYAGHHDDLEVLCAPGRLRSLQQLEILKQGVEAWNKWREDNPDVEVDLRSADLKRVDLKKADFRAAHLERADLVGALVFSVTSFHSRSFFPGDLGLEAAIRQRERSDGMCPVLCLLLLR